jgi:peptidoglycan hydrolase FlgJ
MVAPLSLGGNVAADAIANAAFPQRTSQADGSDRARTQARDFETLFLNSMFQHMYAGVDGDGPFGGSTGVGAWRSFLTDEYAKLFARNGGVGLADSVYSTLIAQQEARSKPAVQTLGQGVTP